MAQCKAIPKTTVCADYVRSNSLLLQVDGENANAIGAATDAASFDRYLSSYRPVIPDSLKCENMMKHMSDNAAAPPFQFALSYECQAFVGRSQCPGQDPGSLPRLCKSTCTRFREDMQAAFSNPAWCDPEEGQQARQAWLDNTQQVCDALDDGEKCLDAVTLERNNCGFGNTEQGLAQAKTFCEQQSSAPCCKLPLKLVSSTGGSSYSNNRIPLIAGIGAGVAFAIAALAFVLYRRRKSKSKPQRTNDYSLPSMSSKNVHLDRAKSAARNSGMWGVPPPIDTQNVRRTNTKTSAKTVNTLQWSTLDYLDQIPQTPSSGASTVPDSPYAPRTSTPSVMLQPKTSIRFTNVRPPAPAYASVPQSPSTPAPMTPMTPMTPVAHPKGPRAAPAPASQSPPQATSLGKVSTVNSTKSSLSRASRYSRRASSVIYSRTLQRTTTESSTASSTTSTTARVNATVIEPYEALEIDEIRLNMGDRMHVERVFDDGWGWGRNLETGERGAFPVVCLKGVQ
ncbi:hypothetical protein BC832DRAFT_561947 [Gaertneriomyces semiglobifer]|nr:hypothetical protein BC832DRAFT_561947 [Gaertneriomyces semiglobifer]